MNGACSSGIVRSRTAVAWHPTRNRDVPRSRNDDMGGSMTDRTIWETLKAEGSKLVDRLDELVREGNVRRVVVEHKGKTVAEFPLTAGIIGAAIAPVAAAIGVLVALLKDCTVKVERNAAPVDPDLTV